MTNTIENVLIVTVLFIIIFIPVYIAIRNARIRKTKKIYETLSSIEESDSLSLNVTEELDSFAIAIDNEKNVLVKVDLKDFKPEMIDLTEVTDCTLAETKYGSTVQSIQLVLWSKKSQPLHHIVFYQQYTDNEGRLKRTATIAAQWEEIIKRCVKGKILRLEDQKS
ncbi:MAG TPA: hypothetical protein VIM55_18755 [Mucilaginibacter sp.]